MNEVKLENLLSLNVNEMTEKKNGLTYLSWANAWREFMKVYPDATYSIIKDANGNCHFGDEKNGYMVYTTVTVEGLTREMWLPVMDYKNKSIMQPTTFDVNKAVMRCLTKNLAMFGLGLYIYAGEDLPEETDGQQPKQKEKAEPQEQEYKYIASNQVKALTDLAKQKGSDLAAIVEYYGFDDIKKMNYASYEKAMKALMKKADKQ